MKGGKRFFIFILVILIFLGVLIAENSESSLSTEWKMFGKNLNHTRWDGNSFTVLPNFNNANFSTGGFVRSSPIVVNGYVYVGSYGTFSFSSSISPAAVYQLNASNISQQIATFSTNGQVSSSPAYANGYIYVGSWDNRTYQLNASNISQQIANFTADDQIRSSPVIANGSLYIASYYSGSNGGVGGTIFQLNASNISKQIANYTTQDLFVGSPAIANGFLYIGSHGISVYQLNASNISIQFASYATGGQVFSSPAVANGYVYVGSDDNKTYQLNALNISQQIASYTTGGAIFVSSPAVTNNYVYIGSSDGLVYQLNASNIGLLTPGCQESWTCTSWSACSGAIQTRTCTDANSCGTITTKPAEVQICNTTVSVYDNWQMFHNDLNHTGYKNETVDISGLQVLWKYNTGFISSSPAVANGMVYVGSANNGLYTFEATTGSLIWKNSISGYSTSSSPAVVNGIVYIGDQSAGSTKIGNLLALNATNGNIIWSYASQAIASSPAVSNGIVYVGSWDNNTYALNATNGSLIWNYTTQGIIQSSPAVANGIVYIGSFDKNLYALNATNGTKIWNYSAQDIIDISSPAVANGIVYIGSWDKNLYALNATNGTKIWNYTASNIIEPSPAIAKGVVYVGDNSGNIYALNATNGTKIWSYATGVSPPSSPAVVNGLVFMGFYTNLYAFNAINGNPDWSYSLGNIIASSPAISNSIVYAGSFDGYVYAFKNCLSSWTCGSWGSCSGGKITRTCIDANSCGTPNNVPISSQACTSSGAENQTNTPITQSASWDVISPGSPAIVKSNNARSGIVNISIATTVNVSSASLIMQQLSNLTFSDFKIGTRGVIYQAFSITVVNLNASNLATVIIGFRVNKTWVQQNVSNPNRIYLYRHPTGSTTWSRLLTTQTGADSDYYYYSAISPGFSTFLVYYDGGECVPTAIQCTNNEVQSCTDNSTWVVKQQCLFGCSDGNCAEENIFSYAYYIAGVMLFLGVIIFVYLRIRKGGKK